VCPLIDRIYPLSIYARALSLSFPPFFLSLSSFTLDLVALQKKERKRRKTDRKESNLVMNDDECTRVTFFMTVCYCVTFTYNRVRNEVVGRVGIKQSDRCSSSWIKMCLHER
jgi:hypothetical protein